MTEATSLLNDLVLSKKGILERAESIMGRGTGFSIMGRLETNMVEMDQVACLFL